METMNAIYDGSAIKFTEPIPVTGQYEVVITFTKKLEDKEELKKKILKHFGTWTDDDVMIMEEVIKERKNFSVTRGKDDIS